MNAGMCMYLQYEIRLDREQGLQVTEAYHTSNNSLGDDSTNNCNVLNQNVTKKIIKNGGQSSGRRAHRFT